MAEKKFTTSLLITGDSTGAQRAIRLTQEQLDELNSRTKEANVGFKDWEAGVNKAALAAAKWAAGATLAATDAVMAGELENAFCAVRPPGHHACRSKSMGFCFINSVAVAAKYALERHGLERVAIVDFGGGGDIAH